MTLTFPNVITAITMISTIMNIMITIIPGTSLTAESLKIELRVKYEAFGPQCFRHTAW